MYYRTLKANRDEASGWHRGQTQSGGDKMNPDRQRQTPTWISDPVDRAVYALPIFMLFVAMCAVLATCAA
jgi:hypothetical protein